MDLDVTNNGLHSSTPPRLPSDDSNLARPNFKKLNDGLQAMSTELQKIENLPPIQQGDRMLEMLQSIKSDTESIKSRVTTIEGQMKTTEGQMKTTERQMKTIERQMKTTERQITTIEGQITTIKGQMTTIEGQMTTIQKQSSANFTNTNARADNAELESLNTPLTPLLSAQNEAYENFPTSLNRLHAMTREELCSLCRAMDLQPQGSKLILQKKIIKFIGVINAPKA